jgi:hypothetical protein
MRANRWRQNSIIAVTAVLGWLVALPYALAQDHRIRDRAGSASDGDYRKARTDVPPGSPSRSNANRRADRSSSACLSCDAYPEATANRHRLIAHIPRIRSVTYYTNYPEWKPEVYAGEFRNEASRIAAAGFNTVAIMATASWFDATSQEVLKPRHVELMLDMLETARRNNLKVILTLGQLGRGYAADYLLPKIAVRKGDQGARHDFCTWYDHPAAWTEYLKYTMALLDATSAHHDNIIFYLFSEAGYDDTGKRCAMTKAAYRRNAQRVRRTLGSLPAEIQVRDPRLRAGIAMVFHDDGYLRFGHVGPDNMPFRPLDRDNELNNFDGFSTHLYWDGARRPDDTRLVYFDQLSPASIRRRMSAIYDRYADAMPGKPFYFHEVGISECRTGKRYDRMERAFRAIAEWSYENRVGWNIWMWTPIYSATATCDGPTGHGGYFLTEPIGQKPPQNGYREATPYLKAIARYLDEEQGRAHHRPVLTSAFAMKDEKHVLVRCDYGARLPCISASAGGETCDFLSFGEGTFATFAYFSCPLSANPKTRLMCKTEAQSARCPASPPVSVGAMGEL